MDPGDPDFDAYAGLPIQANVGSPAEPADPHNLVNQGVRALILAGGELVRQYLFGRELLPAERLIEDPPPPPYDPSDSDSSSSSSEDEGPYPLNTTDQIGYKYAGRAPTVEQYLARNVQKTS
ncbi:hypothetical protein [Circoviridae 10 LDMD-2013]|uniref:hypothetical protein n=1 Tax=Circoviridae 10 LDMD-2013 TaxID=1379714 RepID=UPI0003846EF8|nr:hypothetical protein [Circoviridae 10 LDMD-2013]AGS36208.1 hypothetical protein [Circoviridae 10 LDMD-2013]